MCAASRGSPAVLLLLVVFEPYSRVRLYTVWAPATSGTPEHARANRYSSGADIATAPPAHKRRARCVCMIGSTVVPSVLLTYYSSDV